MRPPSLSNAAWLTSSQTQAAFAALAARGFAARAVGGAVRNALLGLPVADVDIATTARPDDVIAAAEAAGLKAIPTGIAHGTVTVVSGGRAYEITTLRMDVETFGRHATVVFTGDWAADARRRDFTINALYCSAGGEVLDPLGGYADLASRRVRFIGDAAQRIREDYLRILRFFRFTAEYGEGAPHAESLVACVRERAGLARLSPERVRQEMLRLLATPRGGELTVTMQQNGLLVPVLGLAPRPSLLQAVTGLEGALNRARDPILRLGALGIEVPEDADRLQERWKLSNEQHARLLHWAARKPGIGPPAPESAARVCLYAEGTDAFRDRLLVAWARSGDPPDDRGWHTRYALPNRWSPPRFPIGGGDVMALGVPAGPAVGRILDALEGWWIAGDFAAGERELRAKLSELASA